MLVVVLGSSVFHRAAAIVRNPIDCSAAAPADRRDLPSPTTLAAPCPTRVLAIPRATVSAYTPTPANARVPVMRQARQSSGATVDGEGVAIRERQDAFTLSRSR